MSAYCPTSLYKHHVLLDERCSHLPAGSSVMNPGEIGLPKQDRKNSSFAGFASSSQGLFSALATGAES
ncbi:hypothetical protein HZ326_0649 [Fusarium oxysporum f. sp. albedinis]|nr:hypothetical protein HZ326_0649 [Fusarium oxysporum f. sp. albedinis]